MLSILMSLAVLTPAAPLPSAATGPFPAPHPMAGGSEIEWQTGSFLGAMQKAGNEDKHVLVYFWSNGSEQCSRLYGETMSNESVAKAMGDFVCYNGDTANPEAYKLVERYNVRTVPTILVVAPPGRIEDAVIGFISPDGFVAELERIKKGVDTISNFRERAEAAKDDLEFQAAFVVKLTDCGDDAGAQEVKEHMKALDPKRETPIVARLVMDEIQSKIIADVRSEDGEMEFARADMRPLLAYLGDIRQEEVQFEGWSWACEVARLGEQREQSRAAAMKAWPLAPKDYAPEFGAKLVAMYFEDREELSRKEAKFALNVARDAQRAVADLALAREAEVKESGAQGCAGWEGHAEGVGCGGCAGVKGEVARWKASALDGMALAYALNGKKSKALAAIEEGLVLHPEHEGLNRHLALLTGRGE